jgi:hypothetical protein
VGKLKLCVCCGIVVLLRVCMCLACVSLIGWARSDSIDRSDRGERDRPRPCSRSNRLPHIRCGNRQVPSYCGKDCQKAAWPEHKAACKRAAATAKKK